MADDLDVRWGLAQRFEFIEWRAYWTGWVNRKDLEDRFNISTPQASLDFKRYLEEAPNNIEYNATEKSYVAKPTFAPKFLDLSTATRYLRALEAIKIGAINAADTSFGDVPEADVIPPITRTTLPYILRPILQAIEAGTAIMVDYVSLERRGSRSLFPHALAHDGYRWHVRALSVERREYRDYVLARILSVSAGLESRFVEPSADVAWHKRIKLMLVAHPGLKPGQRAAIEQDFRMRDGKLELEMRAALAFYFIRRHNLDIRGHPDLPPERLQLSLQNLEEVKNAVNEANEESKRLINERAAAGAAGVTKESRAI